MNIFPWWAYFFFLSLFGMIFQSIYIWRNRKNESSSLSHLFVIKRKENTKYTLRHFIIERTGDYIIVCVIGGIIILSILGLEKLFNLF